MYESQILSDKKKEREGFNPGLQFKLRRDCLNCIHGVRKREPMGFARKCNIGPFKSKLNL